MSLLLLYVDGKSVDAAAQQQVVPAGGAPVIGGGLAELRGVGSQSNLTNCAPLFDHGREFEQAILVHTLPGSTAEWNTQLVAENKTAVKRDDMVLVSFWARCNESMTGDASIGVVFGKVAGDKRKMVERRLAVGEAWQQFFVPFCAEFDLEAGQGQLSLWLGYDRQSLELADLRVTNYFDTKRLEELPRSAVTYEGRHVDADWREEANRRIEQLRKADLKVKVSDASGRPVAGAEVSVRLLRHEFGFGTCVDARYLTEDTAQAEQYRKIVADHFNMAVFENDMKWQALYSGIPAQTDRALDWLMEHGLRVRGHNLIWPSWRWMPQELYAFIEDVKELRARTEHHIRRTVRHFQGKLFEWDVVNEPYSEHDLIDLLGGQKVMLDWYRLAHKADPEAKLYINDYGIFDSGRGSNAHADHFYETIAYMKKSGAPLHGVGIQSHFSSDLPSPEMLWRTLERFSEFGLPIQSTEISINLEDKQLQADYLRDYMTVMFSHPNVEGLLLWGFWTKRHWRPEAALWDDNWNIRPIGRQFVDLVSKVWTTEEKVSSDAGGLARVRGYKGLYEVSVMFAGKRQVVRHHLGVDHERLEVVLP